MLSFCDKETLRPLIRVRCPPPLLLAHAEFFAEDGSELILPFGGLRGRGAMKQDPPIVRDLYLSLEDLFYGCTKKIKISRRVAAVGVKGERARQGGEFWAGLPSVWDVSAAEPEALGLVPLGGGSADRGTLHLCRGEGSEPNPAQTPAGSEPVPSSLQKEFSTRGDAKAGGKAGLILEQGRVREHAVVSFSHWAVSPFCSRWPASLLSLSRLP